jgi:D-sedoheptulose 7-phosphate isomerase
VPEFVDDIVREIQESIAVQAELARIAGDSISQAARAITGSLRAGGKLIAFGNGGSAADAQHIVAELVGRYRAERKAIAAIALTSNSSSITSIGNDYGFQEIFARQIEALARPVDVVLAISTSGNSPNILRALESARERSVFSIGLTGSTGGEMRRLLNLCVKVPSDCTPRIQEAHSLIIHILSGIVEKSVTSEQSQPDAAKQFDSRETKHA